MTLTDRARVLLVITWLLLGLAVGGWIEDTYLGGWPL